MSISNRIIAGFAAVGLIMIALGGYALFQLGTVRSTVDRIVDRDFSAITQVERIGLAESAMRDARLDALIALASETDTADPAARFQARAAETRTAIEQLRTSTASYEAAAANLVRQSLWRQLSTSVAGAGTAFDALERESARQLDAVRAGDRAAALARRPAIAQAQERLERSLGEVRGQLAETIRAGRTAAQATYDESRLSVVGLLVLALLVGIGIAWTIRRSISGPLNEFMTFAGAIGHGDLTGATARTGRDELGKLGGTLNTMVEGLRDIARQSRQATENLNAAATEIRASTQQQAASVEEQLAAVQETAATVDEITHSGAQISRRAQEVIAGAQATARTSTEGIASVEGTARAMDAIRDQAEAVAANIVALSEKTQAIGDIIATVNDVSERSHLLALNASIEAAAAGENGRSFAIVAAEMKALADQAKDATRNVRGLLGEIQRGINASVMLTEEAVKRVASGKTQIDTSQGAIEELAARVQESVQTFQQIVASTNQQQIGIEQVTIALQNIRQASQQTAASTRQLDQAAGDLTQLSRAMVGLTERYRI